jgi:hypothetical protein
VSALKNLVNPAFNCSNSFFVLNTSFSSFIFQKHVPPPFIERTEEKLWQRGLATIISGLGYFSNFSSILSEAKSCLKWSFRVGFVISKVYISYCFSFFKDFQIEFCPPPEQIPNNYFIFMFVRYHI